MRIFLLFLLMIQACQTRGPIPISQRNYSSKYLSKLKPIKPGKGPGKTIKKRNISDFGEKAFLLKKQGSSVVISSSPNKEANAFEAFNVNGKIYSAEKTESETVSGALFGQQPAVEDEEPIENVFLKTTNIRIEENKDFYKEGSLYKADSDMGNLYGKPEKFKVGTSIDVIVKVKEEAGASGQADVAEEDPNSLKAKLEAAVPSLASDDENLKPLTKIKARILRKLPNGDLEIESYKSVSNENGNKFIRFKAVVPKDKYKGAEQISTNEMEDIKWDEVTNGSLTQKTSMDWQDEYTMRLSGFSESMSREAMQLRRRKQGLNDVKKELSNRIANLSRNRATIAKEREKLQVTKAKLDEELKEVENIKAESKDKDKQIKDLEDKIKALENASSQEQAANNAAAPAPAN